MIVRRLPALLLLLAAVFVLAGCYGSTEPATNITVDHATLHGKGTADQGPADVYFQYWPTAHPSQVTTVDVQNFASETGPVSRNTQTLLVATNYTFRMCGSDRTTGPQGVCAQNRSFTTLQPAGDFVRGGFLTQFTGVGHIGTVDAHSDPGGAHPGGTVTLPVGAAGTAFAQFSGQVTCVRVQGTQAAVGAVGSVGGEPWTVLLSLVDVNPSPGSDQAGWAVAPGSAPPDCAAATFPPPANQAIYSDLAVYDHP